MSLEPLLFSADRRLVTQVASIDTPPDAAVSGVVVDWEADGKAHRQAGAVERIGIDTQISADTADDLEATAAIAATPVLCRLNRWSGQTPSELELAIGMGADEVLLPMVRSVREVGCLLTAAAGRIGVGILIETVAAVEIAADLGRLPLARAYVGLMDLALDRGSPSIFAALLDGTVDRIRDRVPLPLGAGGLTVPGGGQPIPAPLLAGELVRIGCDFSFLRRSFIDDAGSDPRSGVRSIRWMLDTLHRRSPGEIDADRHAMANAAAMVGVRG